jgi:hypothetical protein
MKTGIVIATVVAGSIAGSASAGLWNVANAAANGTPSPPNPFVVNDVASLALADSIPNNINLSGNAANNVVQNANLTSVLLGLGGGAMSASAGNALISFFGLHNTNDGLDYFGFVLDNQTGSAVTLNLTSAFFTTGTNGAISNNANTMSAFVDPTYGAGYTVDTTGFSVGAGSADYFLFAGVGIGDVVAMGGAVSPNSSIVAVQWLTTNYAVAYSDTTTGVGGASVELGLVTNNVPVPAPVLLGGAGLLGAIAARRRMRA